MTAPEPSPAAAAQALLDNVARHLARQWRAPAAAIVGQGDAGPEILAGVGLDQEARALLLGALDAMAAPGPGAPRVHRFASGGWRFLAAAPFAGPAGQPGGALAVLDRSPRSDSTRDRAALSDLAAVVSLSLAMQHSIEQLGLMAISDPLTGLYNRRGLGLLFAEHADRPMALLLIDLDGFKAVNDAHGHAAGDALLVRVADRLSRAVRLSDVVARTGGDEFAILLPDTADPAVAADVARRIHAALAADAAAPSVSIGVALAEAGADPEQLMAAADRNLRAAKAGGKACTVMG